MISNQSTTTVYTYVGVNPDQGNNDASAFVPNNAIPVEQQIVYKDAGGAVLKTENKTWKNAFAIIGDQTLLDNGQGSAVQRCYDINEQISNVYEYGFQSEGTKTPDPACYTTLFQNGSASNGALPLNNAAIGPLRRQTTTVYHSFPSPTYIVNEPDGVTIADGSGRQVKQTTFAFDGSALQPSGATTGLVPVSGARGNVTSVTNWLNMGGTSPVTTYVYFDTGQVQSKTDPCGNTTCNDMSSANQTTTYLYTSSFGCGGGSPSGETHAYLHVVTYPNTGIPHTESFCWGFNTGLLGSHTDQNGLVTGYQYNDPLARLTLITSPDGGQASFAYNDPCLSVTTTKSIYSAKSLMTVNLSDSMGHTTHTQLISDPQGTVFTDTSYDGFGRVRAVANPYRSGTDFTTSSGTTTYGYDAIGRKISETHPDGSITTTAYCGPSTLVTEPGGKWRRSRTDGLGFLVEVDEPNAVGATVASSGCSGPGELIWVTTYTNDVLGNLTNVLQNGSRSRSFSFDSLSRLITSANPEVGQLTYTYDANGNVATKKDARAITTSYGYDLLNRVTSRTYSNSDPSVTIVYDQANCLGLSTCSNVGQRTSMTDGSGSEAWAFQVDTPNLRNLRVDQRTTVNLTKSTTYVLNLAGDVVQITYPTGRIVNYQYDGANRPQSAADAVSGITYATGFQTPPTGTNCIANAVCYTPQGTVYALSIGQTSTFTGLNLMHAYNSRLQPSQFKASSTGGNAIDLSYGYTDPATNKNAGHVFSITNNLDTSRSQTFSYDHLNRITGAQSSSTFATSPAHCWAESYSLDPYGNLQAIAQTTNASYSGCSQESGFSRVADANNHLGGFTYDSSGNTSSDGTLSYVWNGESQLKSAGGTTYMYDGDGRRVAKAGGTVYWYGTEDEILAETNSTGSLINEYVFFGGKRIAVVPASSDSPNGNLASNGGFEQGLQGWMVTGTTMTAQLISTPGSCYLSSSCVQLSDNGSENVAFVDSPHIPLSVGQTITVSGWVDHTSDVNSYARWVLNVYAQNGSGQMQPPDDLTLGTWIYDTATWTVPNFWTCPCYGQLAINFITTQLSGPATNVAIFDDGEVTIAGSTTGPSPTYYVEDMLGTSRVLTTNTGVVCYDADFYPYGGERPYANACQSNYRFEGKERDLETGNDDFGARYYSNRFGRWLSADWSSVPRSRPLR